MKYFFLMTVALVMTTSVSLANHNKGHVDVRVGKLSPKAQSGQAAFNKNCSQCHGNNGEGTTSGPPLIHDIYNPGHHGVKSFYGAVQKGVRAHHWPYGDMPPQPQVGFSEIPAIVTFIREVQVQNGIITKKHRM